MVRHARHAQAARERLDRPCRSFASGKQGCELWVQRHAERLRQEIEAVGATQSGVRSFAPPYTEHPIAAHACEPFPEGFSAETILAKQRCADKLGVRRFRQLAQDHQPPFHYVGMLGDMGVPSSEMQPPRAGANVCRLGELFGRRLQVANPESGTSVEVLAMGSYLCTGALKTPAMQLGYEDAKILFPHRPLAKTEQVLIVPLD